MSDILDDRRQGLEEEYFRQKNREALEKLRAKIAVSQQAKADGISTMTCPRCGGNFKPRQFETVEVDICEKCSGVFLDSDEFEKLVEQKTGWFARLLQDWHFD